MRNGGILNIVICLLHDATRENIYHPLGTLNICFSLNFEFNFGIVRNLIEASLSCMKFPV